MKIGICGGAKVTTTLDTSLCYIGVDKGIETVLENNITPILAVGDFDSLSNKELLTTLQVEQLPTRKDITDTHYALEHAIKQGYDEIYLYGVTGGRLDHFMAVLCLLKKYRDTTIYILNQGNKIQLLKPGVHIIKAEGYTYFSLFAITKATIDITSCQYPLHQYHLVKEDPLCVSNQIVGEFSTITTTDDIILIQSNDI